MTEDQFRERVVMPRLRARGGEWNVNPRSRFTKAGRSDVDGCYRGRFVAIELKRPDGEGSYGATPSQLAYLQRIRDNGGVGIVADNWDVIETTLRCIDAEEDGLCRK